MSEGGLNLALDSIVILVPHMTGRKDFVLWYLRQFGVKRLRRENTRMHLRIPYDFRNSNSHACYFLSKSKTSPYVQLGLFFVFSVKLAKTEPLTHSN